MKNRIHIDRDEIAPASDRFYAWRGDMDLDIKIGRGPSEITALRDLLEKEIA